MGAIVDDVSPEDVEKLRKLFDGAGQLKASGLLMCVEDAQALRAHEGLPPYTDEELESMRVYTPED